MTNEEAIKALRLEGGLEISGNAVRLAQFMEALSVAIDALRRIPSHIDREAWEPCEWVSVEERLPELPDEKYCGRNLICCNEEGYVLPMCWRRTVVRGKTVERWEYMWGKIYDGSNITHWMPMQEPQEAEGVEA